MKHWFFQSALSVSELTCKSLLLAVASYTDQQLYVPNMLDLLILGVN